MEQKHTPEPWCNPYGTVVILGNNEGGFDISGCPSAKANAARIVACVNACAGLDDPQAAIELMKADHLRALKAEAQRDELLAALRAASVIIGHPDDEMSKHFSALLAKHGG